jgi:hypothetical protein
MTSFARQVARRQAKTAEDRLKRLATALPNFKLVAPVETEVVKRKKGDYTPVPNPRKERRKAVQAARRANRG